MKTLTSKVPAGFTTTKFEGICDEYSYTLEQEPWYLLSMDPESGEWQIEVRYFTAEAMVGASNEYEVATLATEGVAEEIAKGNWGAYLLQNMFEVSVVVPEHVCKLMV